MPKINISFDGVKGLKKTFKEAEKGFLETPTGRLHKGVRITRFWDTEIRPYLIMRVKEIFRKEGIGRGTNKWANLNPDYKRRKERMRTSRSSKKLRLHDHYFRALTKPTGNPSHFYARNDEMMQYGVNLPVFASKYGAPYPLWHEEGTVQMKARPVFENFDRIKGLENDLRERAVDFFFKQEQRLSRRR